MRIVVNHLTRMEAGYICVAGWDWERGAHVRPVTEGKRLETYLLRSQGGPFELGAILELKGVRYVGRAPEVEDHDFQPPLVRHLGRLEGPRFWKLLNACARTSLVDIFGDDLEIDGRGCTVEVGGGKASLGCLLLCARPQLKINQFGRLRMGITDGELFVELSVTDIRLYEDDHKTPIAGKVEALRKKIAAGVDLIVGVGLTRPFRKQDGCDPRHYLQVTNVFPGDEPLWE